MLLATCLIHPFSSGAQTTMDELAPEAWFDFWLGTWDLTWEDAEGTMARGINRIERILDGQVIKENFRVLSGAYEGFSGKSYSVYNNRTGQWKQTWVDSNGGYFDFIGEFEGNIRIFKREGTSPSGRDMEASKSGDFKSLRSLLTPDAVMMPPGQHLIRGEEQLIRSYRHMEEEMKETEILDYRLEFEEIQIFGDYAFEWEFIHGSSRNKNKAVEQSSYKLMRILKKNNEGDWKVHRAIWNRSTSGKNKINTVTNA